MKKDCFEKEEKAKQEKILVGSEKIFRLFLLVALASCLRALETLPRSYKFLPRM